MKKSTKAKKVETKEPGSAVFEATLIPTQILADAVKMELSERAGDVSPHEAILTFDRDILPVDYDWDNGAKFKLTITRV